MCVQLARSNVTDHINLLLSNYLLDFPIPNPIHGLIPEFPEQTRHLHVECFVFQKFMTLPTPAKRKSSYGECSRHCLLDLKNLHLRFSNSRRIIRCIAKLPQIIYWRYAEEDSGMRWGLRDRIGIRADPLWKGIGSDI